MARMVLLSESNPKTEKGESYGYLTGILHLAPADESGVLNVCTHASKGCKKGCLNRAGRGGIFSSVTEARIRKTVWLVNDRDGFVSQLRADIDILVRRAARLGLKPAVRVNGTSDLAWIPMQLCADYPDVQFYDYTKLPKPWLRTRPNYHLTFSLHEENMMFARDAMHHGVNVAVVFDTRKGKALPDTWNGRPVVDGDLHDLRFLDGDGVIVGLRAKGPAKDDISGFVQIVRRSDIERANATA